MTKRKEKDVMKLLVSNYDVKVLDEKNNNDFLIKFSGPADSPYEGVRLIDIKPSLPKCL
jgi:ubiquitin-protein ligase